MGECSHEKTSTKPMYETRYSPFSIPPKETPSGSFTYCLKCLLILEVKGEDDDK